MINPFVIMKETEKYFHLDRGSLTTYNRARTTANARTVAMYLVRTLCKQSYTEIGEYFERDHTTVIENCKKLVKTVEDNSNSLLNSAIINLSVKLLKQGDDL